MKKEEIESIRYERCVLCGKETPYKRADNIDTREDYVEGAGQLCDECFDSVYGIERK